MTSEWTPCAGECMRPQTPDAAARILTPIYFSLALGVFLFAAMVLFVLDPLDASLNTGVVRIAWLALAVLTTLGAGIARGRMVDRASDAAQRQKAAIVVWALAEGQALMGVVGTLLTGDPVTAYASLALFVWLWLRYPPGSFVAG